MISQVLGDGVAVTVTRVGTPRTAPHTLDPCPAWRGVGWRWRWGGVGLGRGPGCDTLCLGKESQPAALVIHSCSRTGAMRPDVTSTMPAGQESL